jgi:hypothetical protein
MTAWRERDIIRLLHLILSIPIVGYLYGPVEHIARAAFFVRWIAFPLVVLSGLWMWLKPRMAKRIVQHRMRRAEPRRTVSSAS